MLKLPVAALLVLILVSSHAIGAEVSAPEAGAFKVGTAMRRFSAPEPYNWRGAKTQALTTAIWYPAQPQAEEQPQVFGSPGATPILEDGKAAPNAALAASPARFPLILLSHGTGGTAQSIAWLATALAAQGYIVAGVDHPGNTAIEDYTKQGFMLWWLRAQDLSTVLDALLADPELGRRIDAGRIGAAGFSLGGYTVIELAGGITSLPQYQAFCHASPDAVDCRRPPEAANVRNKAALPDAALREAGKSYRDPRVRAVFAMAPALGPAITEESLKHIAVPVAILAGEADAIVSVDTSDRFYAAHIPGASLTIFPGAVGHYAFLDRCTEAGRRFAAAICVDAPGVDRDAIHRQAAALAIAFFAAHLR